MSTVRGHVCLVSPGHLATDPRLVKEADALCEAGYRVTTVCGRFIAWADLADREFDRRPWTRVTVPFAREMAPWTWSRQRLSQRLAMGLRDLGAPSRAYWRDQAFHPVVGDLARAAARVDADLFIGHNLAGLIAAGRAARAQGALLGFDAEDDHIGELPDTVEFATAREHRERIQAEWLPHCAHLTAASPLMADALGERFEREFLPVLNVFSRKSAGVDEPPSPPLAATWYWMSQTLGPGRGLEQVIDIMGHMHTPAILTLRGRCDAEYRGRLLQRLSTAGLSRQRLVFEEPLSPGQLSLSCAGYALGLSTEIADVPNRDVCLGNKIFHYLSAGVPVALSDTRAQARLAVELGDAAVKIDLDRVAESARMLDAWHGDAKRRARAHDAAWRAGQTRYSWEFEREAWLEAIARCLATRPGAA